MLYLLYRKEVRFQANLCFLLKSNNSSETHPGYARGLHNYVNYKSKDTMSFTPHQERGCRLRGGSAGKRRLPQPYEGTTLNLLLLNG